MERTQESIIAHHEAGHVVAAWHLGLGVERIDMGRQTVTLARSLIRDVAHQRLTVPAHLVQQLRGAADAYAVVQLAGSAAQARHGRYALAHAAAHGGQADYAVVRWLARVFHPRAPKTWMAERERATRRWVARHWPDVSALAGRLTPGTTLAGSALERFLAEVLGPPDGAMSSPGERGA
jgi:hypothetical protein